MQTNPFPVYPDLQAQENEDGVFVQIAFPSQYNPVAHSSVSKVEINKKHYVQVSKEGLRKEVILDLKY